MPIVIGERRRRADAAVALDIDDIDVTRAGIVGRREPDPAQFAPDNVVVVALFARRAPARRGRDAAALDVGVGRKPRDRHRAAGGRTAAERRKNEEWSKDTHSKIT